MAGILDIPPELLDIVTGNLHGRTLESFLFTCKAIFIRSGPAIKRHNECIAKWRTLSNKGPMHDDILWFLWSFAHNPIILEYVETLHLWDRRLDWEMDEVHAALESSTDPNIRSKESMQLMGELVAEKCTPYLQEVDISHLVWWNDVISESSRMAPGSNVLLTIIMLCPNLKELGLPFRYRWDDMHVRLLASLTLLAKCPELSKLEEKPAHRPLKKLETIVPYRKSGYIAPTGLTDLKPFLTLPNLKNLYSVSSTSYHDTGNQFTWLASPTRGTSLLRRIELMHCSIDWQEMKSFLAGTPLLEVLKYEYEPKRDQVKWAIDAEELVIAIRTQVGKTLKELCIRLKQGFHITPVSGVRNLKPFVKLSKLEMDMSLFLGLLGPDEVVPFAELLPSHIASVVLNLQEGECTPDFIAAMFENFAITWNKDFKELKSMLLKVDKGLYDEQEDREQCKAILDAEGIKVRFMDKHRYANTGWRREFCSRFDIEAS